MVADFDFGLDDYPIFDSSYRSVLNAKLLRHYEFMEIGCQEVDKFKELLNRSMCEIMRLYNKYYVADLLEFNPFYTFDLTTTSRHDIDSGGNAVTNTTNTRTPATTHTQTTNIKDVSSNTPDGFLSIGNIENNTYASIANIQKNSVADVVTGHDTSVNADSATNTINTVDEYVSHVVGTDSARTNASILMEFRTSFLNIDMLVINDSEIKNNFLGVW